MTPAQKAIYQDLLAGAYVLEVRHPQKGRTLKLYRDNMVPLRWLKETDVRFFSPLLRWKDKWKKDRKVLDRQAIRRLHGKTLLKKLYKEYAKQENKGTTIGPHGFTASTQP